MCQNVLANDAIVFACDKRQVLRMTNLQVLINPAHILREVLLAHRLSWVRRKQLWVGWWWVSRGMSEGAVLTQSCLRQILNDRSPQGLVCFRLFSVLLN